MTYKEINNVPDYAMEYQFWVISRVDGEFWFYGAYGSEEKANDVASDLGKIAIDIKEW